MANCVQCGRKLPPLFFGKKICEWCVRHEAAKRGEEPEDAVQPVMPTPWASTRTSPRMVTQALFGINLAVFVAMALSGIALDPTSRQLIPWGANYGPLTLGGQPWRLLTSMFVHGGLMHILFNLWCLWDLGALCESLYGHATFAAVYLISGIAGSLASVWWHPAVPSVGASGAIFGIVGALIASYSLGELSLPRFAVAGQLRSVLLFAGYNLLFGAVSGRTDNAAHIGGLVAGLIFGAGIARLAPGRELFPRAAVILVVALLVFAWGGWLDRTRSSQIHANRGVELLDDGKIDQAIRELQRAARERPDSIPIHFALAHAYFSQRQFGLAEDQLKRILALQPGSQPAQYELGIVYLNQGRTGPAKDLFTQILSGNQNALDARVGLGMALADEGNHVAAAEEFKRAAQLGPDDADIYYHLGLSQLHLKSYDEAIAALLKSQQISGGDDSETETALAEAYRAKGMQPEAETAMQKAEKLKPAK
jgi:membrane associated rhomboid family serine protease/Tfp pilus assembly protein PilF